MCGAIYFVRVKHGFTRLEILIVKSSEMWCAENSHELQENPLCLSVFQK